MTKQKRKFLFLQGPMSFFFRELGAELSRAGHEVRNVNFNGGDVLFWNDESSIDYSDIPKNWLNFLKNLQAENDFTDVLMFGDCRFYHATAIDYFKTTDVKIHAFEEGYFRPNWITHDKNGVNYNSEHPTNRDFYDKLNSDDYKYEEIEFHNSFNWKIIYAYTYNIHRLFYSAKRFPHFMPHRAKGQTYEGRGWLKKVFIAKINTKNAIELQKKTIKNHRPYFLLALQLTVDSQIKCHSDFDSMSEILDHVITNFTENAPKDKKLFIKTHPEEISFYVIKRKFDDLVAKYKLADRVFLFDGGNLPRFMRYCEGMITVNSTAGLSVLHHNKPLKVLGRAFYNIAGLADQSDLKDFWGTQTPPDPELFKKFKSYIIKKSQINGGYYNKEGVELLVKNMMKKIDADC